MKAADLREMNRAELSERVEDLRKELFNLRFRLATGELDNVMRIRQVRRDVARTLTVLRQKELAGEPERPTERQARPKARRQPRKVKE